MVTQLACTRCAAWVVVCIVALWSSRVEARPYRPAQARTELNAILSAVFVYQLEHDGNPPPERGWLRAIAFLESHARDPWGRKYVYCKEAEQYVLLSLGADGVIATSDDIVAGDADLAASCGDRVVFEPAQSWWHRAARRLGDWFVEL